MAEVSIVASAKPGDSQISTPATPSNPGPNVKNSTNSLLKKCFSAIVDRKQVNLDMDVLNLILRNELVLNLNTLKPEELSVVPLMLVWYIKTWPGWQRGTEYFEGKLTFKVWYEKFHKYINLKMNYFVNQGLKQAATEIGAEKLQISDGLCEKQKIVRRGQQTDNLLPKSFSPFVIEISAEPSLLNKIVFSEINSDSVLMKCHSELKWENLTVQQLMAWPHIDIHLNSPLFKFSRRNIHEYRRQINLANTPLLPEMSDYIEDVSIIDSNKSRAVYGLTFLTHMAKELLNGLEPLAGRLAIDIDLIGQVLTEFLQDIKDIEFNDTIASNTSITFNMGKSIYSRNKKLSKGATATVISLNETIVPKLKLDFEAFNGLGYVSDAGTISCDYLRILKNRPKSITIDNIPIVSFSCNYCDVDLSTVEQTCDHLMTRHKMAQPVLCVNCKNSFSAPFLAENRWGHACKMSKNK